VDVQDDKPVPYPADPDQPVWNYTQGTELRDPSLKELADYYARLVSWYTQGGFVDELGGSTSPATISRSNYWEIFNEIEANTTPRPSSTPRATTPSPPPSTRSRRT